jgi:hypothetical protein
MLLVDALQTSSLQLRITCPCPLEPTDLGADNGGAPCLLRRKERAFKAYQIEGDGDVKGKWCDFS